VNILNNKRRPISPSPDLLSPDIMLPSLRRSPLLFPLQSGKGTVIAWLWARTVKSPNPAYNHIDVPLVHSFWLSTKTGKEAWVEPVVDEHGQGYHFIVRKSGKPKLEGTVTRNGGMCLLSGTAIPFTYIRSEAKSGRIGTKLMAVIAEGNNGRSFIAPTSEIERFAYEGKPSNIPDTNLPDKALGFRVQEYGIVKHHQLFTNRQLIALTTLSDLILVAHDRIKNDAISAGRIDDTRNLESGGVGAVAYADSVSIYLSFLISQVANHSASVCGWNSANTQMRSVFARQAISMVWDFAESNVFSNSSGSYNNLYERLIKGFETLGAELPGKSMQLDAVTQRLTENKIVSTDPPYYDNIGYADLSDFFYVWQRRSIKSILESLFSTVTVPKAEELIANPYRHGGKEAAEVFFMDGMTHAMKNIRELSHPTYPTTIYYAFKQSETNNEGTGSTGWQSFLSAVIKAGFAITGTWPIRTEKVGRVRDNGTNALASSIVLVCRQRSDQTATISRRSFIRELNEVMPESLENMIGSKREVSLVAAVDLQQASIGPGMSVFSKYTAVLEADGSPMSVRTALQLINRVVDAYLNASDGELDAYTLYCLNWFDQYGWNQGEYGQAEVLATAKGTTVESLKTAGVLESGHGKVSLLRWQDYPTGWNPEQDNRTPVWEALHQLIRALQQNGEQKAGALLAGMPERSEAVRNLAYRLVSTPCASVKAGQTTLAPTMS
jgi:putative DNA methylase